LLKDLAQAIAELRRNSFQIRKLPALHLQNYG
jgi:hypothetical protein